MVVHAISPFTCVRSPKAIRNDILSSLSTRLPPLLYLRDYPDILLSYTDILFSFYLSIPHFSGPCHKIPEEPSLVNDLDA